MVFKNLFLRTIFLCSFFVVCTSTCYKREKKPWTILIFAAADNNLRDYYSRNMKQMSLIGSTNFANIVVHVDIRLMGQKKITRRYYIDKNNQIQIEIVGEKIPMDSGDPQTLISACKWALTDYPADHYCLVLWNHGTGIIDPYGKRHFDTNLLFQYNPVINAFELDRKISFLELLELINDPKGICWDDSTNNYLTNQKLEHALQTVTSNYLSNKKFDIIAFDACLMSMLEIAEITKRYAKIQVSSQEVEPGPGWKYDEALALFAQMNPAPKHFAAHIVDAFAKAYRPNGNYPGFADFTQSALDLELIDKLEDNLNTLSLLLLQALDSDYASSYKNIIKQSRNEKNLTHFSEHTYVDLYHWYTNLAKHVKSNNIRLHPLHTNILKTIDEGLNLIKATVIHNASGSNLPLAHGISIYWPERKIHPSYKKTNFAKNNWLNFLTKYLLSS